MEKIEGYKEHHEEYADDKILVSYDKYESQLNVYSYEDVAILHSKPNDISSVRIEFENGIQKSRDPSGDFEAVVNNEKERLAKLPAHIRRVIGLGLEDKVEVKK